MIFWGFMFLLEVYGCGKDIMISDFKETTFSYETASLKDLFFKKHKKWIEIRLDFVNRN